MSDRIYEVAIIGGGIVGLATALRLAESGVAGVVLVEAESELASHQTGNNSGVIHSGLYYRPGSLKAANCVRGREALYRFCREQDIPHRRCGKLVVATHAGELEKLKELQGRGEANGLRDLRWLDGRERLQEYEPHVNGIAGLWVPETGIVDYKSVAARYAELFVKGGGTVATRFRVEGVLDAEGLKILRSREGDISCRNLINCAGLHSDRVARMCGLRPGLQIIPFRGEYYVFRAEKRRLVRGLIYPVPDPRFPFLGVHFTRQVDDGVEAGPNAVLAFAREGYHKSQFSLRDCSEMLFYRGFWVMGFKYWKMALGEFYRSLSKAAFVKALRRLIPEVIADDLAPGGAGVRAQALEPNGFLVDDFRILEAERMIHVLNAPSPAATASLAIGQTIAEKAIQNFNLYARELVTDQR